MRGGPSSAIVGDAAGAAGRSRLVESAHELPRAGPQVPTAHFRGAARAGARRAGSGQRADAAAATPRLPLHRHARRGQDDGVAHPREVAQLHGRGRPRRHHRHTLRRVRGLPRHRQRALRRLRGTRRRIQPRRRGDHPVARPGGLQAGARTLQGLHDRRSAHAVEPRLQCDAEDAGGAARVPQVRARHDRPAEGAAHRALALPAVQPAADGAVDSAVAPGYGTGRRGYRRRGRRAAPDRTCGAWIDARRAVAHRPGNCPRRRRGVRGGRAPDARRGGPRSCIAPGRGARRARRCRGGEGSR